MRTAGTLIAAAAIGITLAACSADAQDYQQQAADFIEGDEVEATAGTTFTDAECDDPGSTEVGTAFSCTATGADGVSWSFQMEISGEDAFTLVDGGPQP